jgi:hypothetical protein
MNISRKSNHERNIRKNINWLFPYLMNWNEKTFTAETQRRRKLINNYITFIFLAD